MGTFLALSVIFYLLSFIPLQPFFRLFDYDTHGPYSSVDQPFYSLSIIAPVAASIGIGCGLNYDLFGYVLGHDTVPTPTHEYVQQLIVFVLSGIAVNSILFCFYTFWLSKGDLKFHKPELPAKGPALFNIILTVINLLGSAVGIIGFYIDHLRK